MKAKSSVEEPIGKELALKQFPAMSKWSAEEIEAMANVVELPDETSVNDFKLLDLSEIFMEYDSDAFSLELKIVEKSREFLANGRAHEAWMCLLALNI